MGVLHDPLTVRTLLNDGNDGVVLEPDRRIDPEEAGSGLGGPNPGGLGLTYRTHAPRAVTAPPEAVRGQ